MKKPRTLLFTDIEELVTLAAPLPSRGRLGQENLSILKDGAFLSDMRGQLLWVGKRKDAPGASKKIKLNARTVLPGLVDCHTHLLFSGDRSDEFRLRAAGKTYESIAAQGGGILATVRATRAANEKALLELGRKRLRVSAEFGVTTVEIKSGYALQAAGEEKILRVATKLQKESSQKIVRTFLGAHAFPQDQTREAYLSFLEKSLVAWYQKKLYDHLDMFTEEGYYTLKESETLINLAVKHGIPFKIHADEFTPLGGARLGVQKGALSVDHLLHAGLDSQETIEIFRNSSTVPVLLPGTAFFLKLPYPSVTRLLEAGVYPALATDFNPGSCMTQNLPFIMTLAVLYLGMTVEEAIVGCTVRAAAALGLSDVGRLTSGARADFQVLDVPFSQLVYEFGRALPRETWALGKKIKAA